MEGGEAQPLPMISPGPEEVEFDIPDFGRRGRVARFLTESILRHPCSKLYSTSKCFSHSIRLYDVYDFRHWNEIELPSFKNDIALF